MHLTSEELVDLAEGTRAEAAAPHLVGCELCQTRLADLRNAIAAIESGAVSDVPEPSPVFWDQFQRRVSEAVSAERERRSAPWWRLVELLRPRVLVPLTTAAALAVTLIAVNLRSPRRPSSTPEGLAPVASIAGDGNASAFPRAELLRDSMDDDPSFQLITDLASDADWSAADVAGLSSGFIGHASADHAVDHMAPEDLKELQRLLKVELGT